MGIPLDVCEYCYLSGINVKHGSKSRQTGNNYGIWVDLTFELLDANKKNIKNVTQTLDLATSLTSSPSAADVTLAMASSSVTIASAVAAAKLAYSGYSSATGATAATPPVVTAAT